MVSDLLDKKKILMREKYNLSKKIELLNEEIKKITFEIAHVCKKNNNGHMWLSVREGGQYGEKFTFCKLCKIKLDEKTFYE